MMVSVYKCGNWGWEVKWLSQGWTGFMVGTGFVPSIFMLIHTKDNI